ncbi:LexA repressor-like protein [Paenibacillus larvae subsp. larvae]|uniref:LexA repressor-like protein n=1 Tax=Paenibacillus larvae subsp. larvae TaxID=147375 RepID=A0A6C0QZ60_9BACL|nr:LexA repressor-like protein [Paenibacillus larvae subsp. larvae]
MAPFIFWNLAFYTIIRTQLQHVLSFLLSATMSLVIFFLNLIEPSPFFILIHKFTLHHYYTKRYFIKETF